MDNIEQFNLCTAHVLARLYNEFPVARTLPPDEIVKELGGAIIDDTVKGIDANHFVAYTISWLVETDYLRITRKGTSVSTNRYVLSPKAFEVLTAELPEALREKAAADVGESLGESLSKVAKEVGKDLANETKKQSLSQMVKFGLSYGAKWLLS